MSYIDYTGLKQGKLTVIERCGINKRGRALWRCRCDCGNEVILSSASLRQGTQSCGCKIYESHNKRHGMTKTDIHNKWCGMKERCNCTTAPIYRRYGARGIKVCEEWNSSFESFMYWSFSHGYREGLSLDRIDNSKGYSPENCRWVEWADQSRNRRNNLNYTIDGETKTLKEWCTQFHKNYNLVYQRIKRDGYSFEQAMSSRPYEFRGCKK